MQLCCDNMPFNYQTKEHIYTKTAYIVYTDSLSMASNHVNK